MKLSTKQPDVRHRKVAHLISQARLSKARFFSRACLLAFLGLAFQSPTIAAEADPGQLFKQGQGAFRSGDAIAAISLYRQADAAGFSDPVLFFNLGVAQYRAGRVEAARDAFLTASATANLAPLSFYNLGLVARKLGDERDAAAWFSQARRHPRASEKLRALSRKAQASLAKSPKRKRPVAYINLEGPKLADHLRLSVNSGFASDSNVYRSHSEPYVDLSDPAAPTIDPVVQSGTYIPVEADAELRWGTHEDSHFAVRYALDGRFYSGAEFSNANEIEHEFSLGGAVNRKTKRGGVRWRSHFIVTSSDEQAYDRDDGQDESVGADDVSDRFSNTRFGPKAYYHRDIGRFGFGFRGEGFIARYKETLDYLDLTHEQYLGGVHLSMKPLRRTLVRLSGDYYQRLYADRAAKDIDGIRFSTNDTLEYHYQNLGLTVRQQLGRSLVIGLDYRFTQREDVFENYDDYDRHSGRAYLRFHKGRFSTRAAFTYRTYEFPNAFAFDNPAAGERTLDTSFGQFEAEFRVSRRFAIKTEALLNIVESSDPRADYDRNRLSASLSWRM